MAANAIKDPPGIFERGPKGPTLENKADEVTFIDGTFNISYQGQKYILGNYGWEDERGKPVNSDMAAGLSSAVMTYALEKQNKGAK
jgi:geranylgeranyl pyrophosphate synthase